MIKKYRFLTRTRTLLGFCLAVFLTSFHVVCATVSSFTDKTINLFYTNTNNTIFSFTPKEYVRKNPVIYYFDSMSSSALGLGRYLRKLLTFSFKINKSNIVFVTSNCLYKTLLEINIQ